MTDSAKAFYQRQVNEVEAFQVTNGIRDQIEALTALRDELTRKLVMLRKKPRSAGNTDAVH